MRSSKHIKAQKEGKSRDGFVCQICGSDEHVEGHHVIDVARGGAPDSDNIIALCSECHRKVHQGKIDISVF